MKLPANWPWRHLKMLHYRLIHIDPPWDYETRSAAGQGRSASRHYRTMSFEELAALTIADLAAPDCLIAMWVTDTHLLEGLKLFQAWGIDYSTIGFVWLKTNKRTDLPRLQRVADLLAAGDVERAAEVLFFLGMGHWTRANAEIVLLGKYGSPVRLEKDVRSIIVAPLRDHSQKPDEIYARLRRLAPGPACDLFGRLEDDDFWTTFGDQAGKYGARTHG